MLRKIILFIIIIASYILQTTFKTTITFGNISPNLILIVVTSFALIRGKKEGMYLGFFSGLLVDIFFGYGGVVGFHGLTYMYIGYVMGLLFEIFYMNDILIPVVLIGISDIFYNMIYYIIAFLLRNKLDLSYYFRTIMLPEAVYTLFVGVFLYKLFLYINKKLESYEKRGEKKYGKRNFGDTI